MVQINEQQAITAIHDYWFADIGAGFEVKQQHKIWYGGGAAVDQEIEQRFGKLVVAAVAGDFTHWGKTADGALALVLLLDQFTRNIYRADAAAFAGDALARELVRQALAQSLDQQLTLIQRSFFYMPLEHSESLDDQRQCIVLFEQLLAQAPEQGKSTIAASLDFAIKHCAIIERFGRFPHRNKALGRGSTAEEVAYLQQGCARFGQ